MTYRPDRTRNLANVYLQRTQVGLCVQPLLDLAVTGRLKKELDGLLQIGLRLFDGVALAGHVQFRAQSHPSLAFALHPCCQRPS